MGQDIKYIIIESKHEVPKAIVHFRYETGTILPIDLYDGDYERTMKSRADFETSDALFAFMLERLYNEESVNTAIKWFKAEGVKTFIFSGYREIMDLAEEIYQLNFLEGRKVERSDPEFQQAPLSDLLPLTNEPRTNEALFFSYDDAFYTYFEDEPERELVRMFE
ncbi:MAG: hypothetical protein AAF598_20555 [Bacteroidota bacterium]